MKIFFIILHYRGLDNTYSCIDSLLKMTSTEGVDFKLVVVDNFSPEPFVFKKNEKMNDKINLIVNTENFGYSGGMNTGINFALAREADYIVVVNNDTEFDKGFLQKISKRLRAVPQLNIVVPKIYFYPGTEFHNDRYNKNERGKVIWYAGGQIDWDNVIASHIGVDEVDHGQYDSVSETEFATGCCIVFKTELLRKIGLFDDKYYLYYEDIDLSIRSKQAGSLIGFEPSAVLWHKNAKSAGGAGSPLQDYYITRNRLLFGTKYAPLRAKVALIRESVKTLFFGRIWQKKGVQDFYLKKFGKGSFRIT